MRIGLLPLLLHNRGGCECGLRISHSLFSWFLIGGSGMDDACFAIRTSSGFPSERLDFCYEEADFYERKSVIPTSKELDWHHCRT